MSEDFELADYQKHIAAPHKGFGSEIEWVRLTASRKRMAISGAFRREEVIAELTYDVVAGGLSIQNRS